MSIQLKTSSQRILILYIGPVIAETSTGTIQSAGSNAVSKFLYILTGTQPSQDVSTLAGYTSHPPLRLTTRYYDANIGIWCDEIPNQVSTTEEKTKHNTDNDDQDGHLSKFDTIKSDNRATALAASNPDQTDATLTSWLSQMASEAAKEVRGVIGAIIIVLPYKRTSISSTQLQSSQIAAWTPYVEILSTLRDQIEDETGHELGSLVVLQDQTFHRDSKAPQHASNHGRDFSTFLETFQDECISGQGILGWDFVQISDSEQGAIHNELGTNAYGEKTGMDRVFEVLQAVDWFASTIENSDGGDEAFTKSELDLSFLDDINPSSLSPLSFKGKDREPPHFASDGASQSEHDFQRELIELKMAMLDANHDQPGDQAEGEDFGDFSSALDRDLDIKGKDDNDVWTALDHKYSNREDMLVDDLPGLLERVVAIREAGADMNSTERERFAKREIGRLMKDL